MEIQFRQEGCPYLRSAVCQYQTQEQTQEVRLPDSMPDIGRVLGCWGQILIRGKEWRGSGMMVSGGVMAWVLYVPEDGSKPASMECWIPFQMRWDFPQTQRDGSILVDPVLRSMDARSTSARKLMVRANIGATGQALEPAEEQISVAEGIPEDVQLLKKSYPMMLPLEYGEKLFDVEEELPFPDGKPCPEKVLHYDVQPEVLEHKVMAGRLVFRGKANVHMLYQDESDGWKSWECELPFSQYAQLDRDYSGAADADIQMVLTSLDLQRDENNRMQLKCQMAGQYVICDRVMVDVAEDAYSPVREVELQQQEMKLPYRLDRVRKELSITGEGGAVASQIFDVCCMTDDVKILQNGNEMQVTVPVKIQVLYADENGELQSSVISGKGECVIPSAPGNHTRVKQYISQPRANQTADSIAIGAECQLDMDIFAEEGNPMVSGVRLGEITEPDPNRPSLILRSCGEEQLWDIAKKCNTTVEAIRSANQLECEPEKGQILLIPVP